MENSQENAKAVIVRLHATSCLKQSSFLHAQRASHLKRRHNMKARLVVILCTILFTLFAFGQMGIVMAAGSEKQVPSGSPIADSALAAC